MKHRRLYKNIQRVAEGLVVLLVIVVVMFALRG